MIVFDLNCGEGHCFEAWFRNNATFEQQSANGEISCPMCGNTNTSKAPMTPRILRNHETPNSAKNRADLTVDLQRAVSELTRAIAETCDYVGEQFANEARKIHYGETKRHNIYGEASSEEARELAEEGIDFATIPRPRRTDS